MARLSAANQRTVLALNCGSSSLKFGMYTSDGSTANLLCEGELEEIGSEDSTFWFKSADQASLSKAKLRVPDHAGAAACALDALAESRIPQPEAVGHRFVHGGPYVREHQRITAAVVDQLRAASDFAPLHVPAALSVLELTRERLSDCTQIACIDTAFHRNMPDVSRTFALPPDVQKLQVERFGFHGLSLESILAQLNPVPDRLVVAHLGNGSSITAIRDGKSIDTTMGLTPTGGVMMGTRSGDLDPGLIVYLMRHGYASPDELERLFDHRSGLLGLSGKSSDVRELLAARKNEARADLALRMFCYQVRKAIAAMAAALGGLDAVIFTGGIGEHAAELRDEIRFHLDFLGRVHVRVMPSEEDLQIARITAGLAV